MDEYKSEQIIEDQAASIRQLTMILGEAENSKSQMMATISHLEYSNETLEKRVENLNAEVDRLKTQVNTTCPGHTSQAAALRDLERIVDCVYRGYSTPKISLIKALRGMTGIGLKEAKNAIEGGDFYFNNEQPPMTLGDILQEALKNK